MNNREEQNNIDEEIKNITLDRLLDLSHLKQAVEYVYQNPTASPDYWLRLINLYHEALITPPILSTFNALFDVSIEDDYKKYRSEHHNDYENLFGKICTELKNNTVFDEALLHLSFLDQMQSVLGKKGRLLVDAMKKYFVIYHGDDPNKVVSIQLYQNTIAKLSALYVAKSKEVYKKEKRMKAREWILPYFNLNLDHPDIKKKIKHQKQKQYLKALYQEKDEALMSFLQELIDKEKDSVSSSLLSSMIDYFILQEETDLSKIVTKPSYYDTYKTYKKTIKLTNRLNSGYISYDGDEVKYYRSFITFDEKDKTYKVDMKVDDELLLSQDNLNYEKWERVFRNLRKEIILKAHTLDVDESIPLDFVNYVKKRIPMSDEYYIFDSQKVYSMFNLSDFLEVFRFKTNALTPLQEQSFVDEEAYQNTRQLFVNNGLLWIMLFVSKSNLFSGEDKENNIRNYQKLIHNMYQITTFAKDSNLSLEHFSDVLLINAISSCCSREDMAILGKDVIEKLYLNTDFTNKDEKVIVDRAKRLFSQGMLRSQSTVPYIKGHYGNYSYALYDTQDETALLSGINTDSCFRPDGTDNDFMHYCILDKNGFIIKICDYFGNFIARASGFRNGNCVLINQLRTIYDKNGLYRGSSQNEQQDIIETFKKACNDIVTISQNNPLEAIKIDFVFVNKSYTLAYMNSNVAGDVFAKITNSLVDTKSEDWLDFVGTTKNLKDARFNKRFTTDYGDYQLVCMASKKKRGSVRFHEVNLCDVPAVYERERNKVEVVLNPTSRDEKKVNRIRAVSAFFKGEEYIPLKLVQENTLVLGDNWYLVWKDGEVLDTCILVQDEKAKKEYAATISSLEEQVLTKKDTTFKVLQKKP